MPSFRTIAFAVLVLGVSSSRPLPLLAQQQRERRFLSGYAGSLPTDSKDLARTYFNTPAVRRLLYRLEPGPLPRAEAEAALLGSGYRIDDLLRIKILRADGDKLGIGFNYFTLGDMKAIDRVADTYVPKLVAGYQASQAELTRLLSTYPVKTVPPGRLAFALIAGISLNWDGLALTLEKGYRRPELVTGPDWQYSFWASEAVPGRSLKGYFWGSSSFPAGRYNYPTDPVDFTFSSFGDPSSDPRMSFPDLLYLPAESLSDSVRRIASALGLHDEQFGASKFERVLGLELGRPVAEVLFALRRQPMTTQELQSIVSPDQQPRLPNILALLVETQYLASGPDQRYHLTMPVLDRQDAEMVQAVLALSRSVMERWLTDNYASIRSELADLTALRQGVPFESLFTQIWHELFGRATRDLAQASVIADPYGPEVRSKGSLPLLWRSSLYRFDPQ